jgi:hypothetical protein
VINLLSEWVNQVIKYRFKQEQIDGCRRIGLTQKLRSIAVAAFRGYRYAFEIFKKRK